MAVTLDYWTIVLTFKENGEDVHIAIPSNRNSRTAALQAGVQYKPASGGEARTRLRGVINAVNGARGMGCVSCMSAPDAVCHSSVNPPV